MSTIFFTILWIFPETIFALIFGNIFSGENSHWSTTWDSYWCSAAYSCYNSISLQRVADDTSGNIGCFGLSSCMNIDLLYNNYGALSCLGEKSCYHSNIYQMSPSTYQLPCDGDRSCAESSIHTTTDVYFHGHLSGINSKIYSYNNVTNYHLYGFQSGDGATIFCATNTTCIAHCDGSACNNLTFICHDDSNTSCSLDTDCTNAEKSDLCPNGYSMNDTLRLPSIKNISISTFENSLLPCKNINYSSDVIYSNNSFNYNNNYSYSYNFTYNPINCQLNSECRDRAVALETNLANPGAICCSGIRSCSNGSVNISTVMISPKQFEMAFGFKQLVAIRCDAENSCHKVKKIEATNGGNVFSTGIYSTVAIDIIKTTNISDIFCSGRASCAGSIKFFGANNLYCLARYSCQTGIVGQDAIGNRINNVWAYAREAFTYGSMADIISNVYCGGYRACFQTDFTRIGSTVHGQGYQVFYASIMTNITQNVIVIGTEGAYSGEFSGIGEKVIGIGENVLSFTTITNVSKVRLKLA